MSWALDATRTGKLGAEARLVLVTLADYADSDGRGAYPSASTIAERLGTTVRSVRRSLASLAAAGLIGAGDERLVWKFHANSRPAVWDLAVHGRQTRLEDDGTIGSEPHFGVTAASPRRGDSSVTPETVGGDTRGHLGVTAASPKPRTKPKTLTHLSLKGDPKRARARDPIAAMSVPADPSHSRPIPADKLRCPACGAVKTHRCRSSALDPGHPLNPHTVPGATVAAALDRRDLAPAAPPVLTVVDELPLEDHDPCIGCGTTSHRRPLIDDTGMCLRCHYAHTREGFTRAEEGA